MAGEIKILVEKIENKKSPRKGPKAKLIKMYLLYLERIYF